MIQVLEVRNFRRVVRKLSTTPVVYLNSQEGEALTSDSQFNNQTAAAGNSGQATSEINEMNFVNENTSVVSFHLSDCEFHGTNGANMFAAGNILNNGANAFVGTDFAFNYSNITGS